MIDSREWFNAEGQDHHHKLHTENQAASSHTEDVTACSCNSDHLVQNWIKLWSSCSIQAYKSQMISNFFLSWYHYDLTRHAAEALLLSNGKDGSYLLRNSNEGAGCFALSVRSVNLSTYGAYQWNKQTNKYTLFFVDFVLFFPWCRNCICILHLFGKSTIVYCFRTVSPKQNLLTHCSGSSCLYCLFLDAIWHTGQRILSSISMWHVKTMATCLDSTSLQHCKTLSTTSLTSLCWAVMQVCPITSIYNKTLPLPNLCCKNHYTISSL